ncbi:Uncharacterized protein At5g41620 [Linum perenne]
MPRQNRSAAEELLPGKIRKRGCSSSASSSSSVVHNYRFKRAILVGKRGAGSTTPLPTWRLIGSTTTRTPSSVYSASLHGGAGKVKQQQGPVSARKLAATFWEMNEVPSPRMPETSEERRMRKEARAKERAAAASRSVYSGSLPPHLSDPSHSPVSERGDRSVTGSRSRRPSSSSQKLRQIDQSVTAFDSVSNASFMEIETRSRVQTPTGSRTRLKDVSNALTTSKELLKIINRVWGNEDRPSSSMSLMSALHAELERARLQVNQVIHEQRGEQGEINYLMKCFAEEKAAWKRQEHKLVEAAIESVAGELEVERKLRRRFEGLNKKLGKELCETKGLLVKAVKELEQEKRARAVMEHVCDELANDIGEDKAEAEEMKRESVKLYEEVEKEREMLQLADSLREERVHMKLEEAKHQLEEKNAAVDKLRGQLQVYLGGAKRGKEKRGGSRGSVTNYLVNDADDDGGDNDVDDHIRAYLSGSYHHDDNGEVENGELCDEEDTAESDLHSIELGLNRNKSLYGSGTPRHLQEEEIIMDRKSSSGKVSRKSGASLQRSISDVSVDHVDRGRLSEFERHSYGDDHVHGHRSMKGRRDLLLCGSGGVDTARSSPNRQSRLSAQDRPPMVPGIVSKSRLSESRIDRKSRR